jgi:PAT family beta-lactamase induction signal transducer AmpG
MHPLARAVPAPLRAFTERRTAACLLLGFSSGLPLVLTGDNLQLWIREDGFDLKTVGALTLVGLPYVWKAAWAPLLDRFALPFLDRRRGWILVFQVLLAAAIAGMSLCDPRASLSTTVYLACAVAFLSASQDVVIDAWRADALPADRLAPGAAAHVTGYRIGMIAGGAGALLLVGTTGWATTYLVAAGAMAIGVAGTFVAPPPLREAAPGSFAEAVVEPFREFLLRRGAVALLAFVVLFKLPDVVASSMTAPFLKDLGIPLERIGAVRQGLGVFVTIGGTLAGAAITVRMGLRRALWVFGVLQAVSNLAFVGLASAGPSDAAMVAAIVVENFCGGLVTAGFVAFLASLCDARYSATQFALLTALNALARTVVGAPAGAFAEAVGWPAFFAWSAVLGLPGLLLLRWTRTPDRVPEEAARLAAA